MTRERLTHRSTRTQAQAPGPVNFFRSCAIYTLYLMIVSADRNATL